MKMMIVDTFNHQNLNAETELYFANYNVRSIGEYLDKPANWHGLSVAYYATILLTLTNQPIDLVFCRVGTPEGNIVPNFTDKLVDYLYAEKPDVANISIGGWDGDWLSDDFYNNLKLENKVWIEKMNQYKKDNPNTVIFSAAGNEDANDKDKDINVPFCFVPWIHLIGSHNKEGIPSKFSGDGIELESVFWGEKLKLLHPDGSWIVGSGTSFASPKACGLYAFLYQRGLVKNDQDWIDYTIKHTTKPTQYVGRHVKYGYGSLEEEYQKFFHLVPSDLIPRIK